MVSGGPAGSRLPLERLPPHGGVAGAAAAVSRYKYHACNSQVGRKWPCEFILPAAKRFAPHRPKERQFCNSKQRVLQALREHGAPAGKEKTGLEGTRGDR